MKEYAIYRINNGGEPFVLDVYKDLMQAKLRIYDLVSYWEEKNYFYYIDNDFFKNKYPLAFKKTFYCRIIFRDVSEWKVFNENENSNITFLNNFK